MSYAGRLVAMARGEVPRVGAPASSEPAAVEETHAEIAAAPPAAAAPMIGEPHRSSPAPAVTPSERTVAPAQREQHTTIVERVREVAVPAAPPPPAELHIEDTSVERVVLPAPMPRWLAEDPSASDPLVASADTDALAELMRSVRQWTSSPPTIVETQAPPARERAAQVVEAAVPIEPVQVTIGNVVVTVEDAPAATPRGRATPPTRAASDRLARNHIRGS